jgi:hypothetical protein
MSSPEMKEFQKLLYEEIIIKQISRYNPPQISQKCISTLLRIVNNILEEPYNEKFRKLPEKNNLLNSNVLQITGGRDFLVKIGFKSKVVEFEKFFILEVKNTAPIGKDGSKKISDELFLTRQLERLEIAQKLLEDYLKKVTEHAEAVRRMQEKEKRADELQKAAVLKNIEEDKERRQKQQDQLKLRRQLEKEAESHEEKLNVNEEKAEFEQQHLEQPPFYRPYHHSHFEQKKN